MGSSGRDVQDADCDVGKAGLELGRAFRDGIGASPDDDGRARAGEARSEGACGKLRADGRQPGGAVGPVGLVDAVGERLREEVARAGGKCGTEEGRAAGSERRVGVGHR